MNDDFAEIFGEDFTFGFKNKFFSMESENKPFYDTDDSKIKVKRKSCALSIWWIPENLGKKNE